MPQSNARKLTQTAAAAILIAATGAALAWLAQPPATERGARGPDLPAPPAPPSLYAPVPLPAPGEPPIPAAPSRDVADPAAPDSNLAPADPAGPARPEPAAPPRTTPWRALDPGTYSLTPATIPLYVRLPGTYEWPLPTVDRLQLSCFQVPDQPAHLSVMQTADGRLYHWGEDRPVLREHLEAGGIDSREIRTVSDPGAFMEPLRAAAQAACERGLQDAGAPGRPR